MRSILASSVVLLSTLAACSSSSTPGSSSPTAKSTQKNDTPWVLPNVPPVFVLPDVGRSVAQKPSDLDRDRRVVGRMRVVVHDDGSLERAADLLPTGRVFTKVLPARLGGGFLFVALTGRGTQLWRAESYLAPLGPLVELNQIADAEEPVVVGFDRLYVRVKSGNELVALDPTSGKAMGLGPLPPAPSWGDMVFLDGWRAVVNGDVRGVMATFDAGATWRPLQIRQQVKGMRDVDERAIIDVDAGSYTLDAKGFLSFAPSSAITGTTRIDEGAFRNEVTGELSMKSGPQPTIKEPLRLALRAGYPDSTKTAIVAEGGVVARISLADGKIMESHPRAYAEKEATCTGLRLSDGVGFVCAETKGRTVIYATKRDLSLERVLAFDTPRVVTESGQGALVVSGPCEGSEVPADSRAFCVRHRSGAIRDIRVRGQVGGERVVALADERVVIVVPPRPGTMGQISIIDGRDAKHLPIRVPPEAPAFELENGLWLDGFYQSGKQEIGGWVEAGGPLVGVRLSLDGKLTSGEIVEEPAGILVSGPFGLAVGDRGRGLETVDGGKTWRDVQLPFVDAKSGDVARDERARRCGVAGCLLPGVLRIGWGDTRVKGDLEDARAPQPLKTGGVTKFISKSVEISCTGGTKIEPPKPKPATVETRRIQGEAPGGWASFRGAEPPPLAKGEVGIDNGAGFDQVPVRVYAWGKKDADWGRTGRFQIRFADRFALDDVKSTNVTTSPFSDETLAAEAMGVGSYSYGTVWGASIDPNGDAALVSACRQRFCSLYSAVEGRAAERIVLDPRLNGVGRPYPPSAIRFGGSWFFVSDGVQGDRAALYRTDGGVVRLLADLPRPRSSRFATLPAPKLVRRAKREALGLLFLSKSSVTERRSGRYVVEVDPRNGELGEVHDLGPSDATIPRACDAEQDGWIIDGGDARVDLEINGTRVSSDSIELRLRADEGTVCLDRVSVQGDNMPTAAGAKPAGGGKPKAAAPACVGKNCGASLVWASRSRTERGSFRCVPRLKP